jgi:hypothetical protein
MATKKQPPVALALIAAESIHFDEVTQKFYILGTVSTLGAVGFPWVQPTLDCYVELTDGYGETEIELRLVDVEEEDEPLFALKETVRFDDPLHILQWPVRATNVVFPEAGDYRLQLWANDSFLTERRIAIIQWEGESE